MQRLAHRCGALGLLLSAIFVLGAIAWAEVADWPQFRGPNRDDKSAETGLLKEWPEGGPKLVATIEGLGAGFSTVSIAGGRIFTMGDRKPAGDEEGQFVIALDLANHKELWATRVGPAHHDTRPGPRCTPTVDGELLYALGTGGDLICAEAATGKVRWQKNFAKDFGGEMMSRWKYSESPTVDGDRLVCTPGGPDAMMVALDKKTGQTIWKCKMPAIGANGKDGAAYSTPTIAEIEGVRQYVQLVGRGVIGVDAQTGKFLWGYNRIANVVANITSPVVKGSEVFCSTAYKTGCALLRISRQGDQFKADEVYFHDADHFSNHHGGMILLGDYLYGGDGQNRGSLCCLEFATGKVVAREKALAKGCAGLLWADGRLYVRYEDKMVFLVDASPEGFKVKGSLKTPGTGRLATWPHPVIHDGKLYLRDQDVLLVYDLRGR